MREPEPLTHDELERLWRWERRMARFHAAAMVVLLLGAAAAVLYGDLAWFRRSLLGAIAALVLVATILQVQERCPRCRARLRVKTLMRLPERCGICGVVFQRPPPPSI